MNQISDIYASRSNIQTTAPSKFVRHLSCEACGSSDGNSLYSDGHTHCFSCGSTVFPNRGSTTTTTLTEINKNYQYLEDRKISKASAEKYGIWRDGLNTYFPYYHPDGRTHLANKIRYPDKEFSVEGDLRHSGLFGQHLFPAGSAKFITIVEGEYDAPSAHELMGSRWPCVSVRNGADGATRDVADNFEYLNSFPTIVICFDKDEAKINEKTGQVRYPGQEAALAVAGMFPIGKVKVLTLAEAKDPNDYLKAGLREQFNREWWSAPGFTPSGLKLGREMWEEISEPKNYETVPYPWNGLNAQTYGIRLSELVVVTAETGLLQLYIKIAKDKLGELRELNNSLISSLNFIESAYLKTHGDEMLPSRLDRDEVHSFVGHQAIKRFFDEQPKDVMYVAHNGISYDGPSIQRLLGVRLDSSNIVDTLVLSYLYDPAMAGGHSLEAWGDRLRFPKGSWSDWSKYSIEQDEYCQQDVRLGKKVFKALVTRLLRMGCSELACEIEHQIREVIDEQQSNGWFFDIPGAQSLVGQLRAEQQALERSIRSVFPPRLVIQNSYIRRQKKDGGDYSSYLRHLEEYPRVTHNTDDGTYDCWDWEEFNIGSPQQRISRLLEAGYNPISFTPTGQPKVDEESLLAYAEESGKAEVRSIAEWIVLQGRSTMIEGWLNNVNYDDSCMHGKIFTCGATTRRMTHREPNTANIPKSKPRVKYGKECRSLWRARPGRIMVGYDAKGLEMRTLAHYLGTEEAIKLFTEGDPHMVNTRALGMPDEMRDITVKNGFYCLTYGGQDPKLGRTLRPELQGEEAKKYGKWARSILEKSVP
ncbi:unnamed protein product, partial [Sphagnum compactum]